MKKTFQVVMLIVAVIITGCAIDRGKARFETELGEVEYESADMGRYTAWAKAELARLKALQALGVPKAPKESKEQVIVNLDTTEKILQWTMYKNTEAMADAMKEMAGSRKGEAIAAALKPTPMPKGAVAEGIESTGEAIQDVANTPTAVLTSSGVAMYKITKEIVSKAGDKVSIDGDDNQVDASKSTSQVVSDRGSVATGAPTGRQQTSVVKTAPEPTVPIEGAVVE